MLAKVKGEPDKMKKQADIAKTAADSHEQQAVKNDDEIKSFDHALNEQMKRRKELEEQKMQLVMEAERHRIEITARQAKADDIKKALQTAQEESAHAMADRSRLELEQKNAAAEAKREQDNLNRKAKEYSNALKNCKRAEVQLQTSQAQVPFMRRQLEEATRQVQSLLEEGKKQRLAVDELKRDVDIFINSFLKQESIEKEKQEALRILLDSIKELEAELVEESRYEQQQRKEVARLTAERETSAREAAKAVSAARETHEELKVKELVIIDLSKKHVETGAKLREFSKLYDIVKADRNKYVNQIAASAQALAEMKEKIKILQNEVEILRNESVAKDKALSKERLDHQNAFTQRDALRAEQNKHMVLEKEKKAVVAQLAAETDNLNSLINGIEKDMLKLKKRYEAAVEERNYTGIQLIDRNDELCILYEKSNMQQAVLKKGELAIREREDEIRMLDLQVAELCREIEVTRRKLPKVAELEQEIVLLQTQLEEERAPLGEKLSAELEAPSNSKRWRKLEGKDPEPEDLAAKLQVLEERVADKKEQLLEKDLVLEEVSNLANRLRTQALEGREDTLELAKRVNDFQSRIKSTTRRMMATVSELSMYQATAMKLTQENTFKDEQRATCYAILTRACRRRRTSSASGCATRPSSTGAARSSTSRTCCRRARPRNSRTRQPSRAPTHTSPTTSASRSPTARSHPSSRRSSARRCATSADRSRGRSNCKVRRLLLLPRGGVALSGGGVASGARVHRAPLGPHLSSGQRCDMQCDRVYLALVWGDANKKIHLRLSCSLVPHCPQNQNTPISI